MSITLNLTDAKARLSELVTAVETTHEEVSITRNGEPAAVLISAAALEALRETLAIMRDPELVASIEESEAALGQGDPGTTPEEMRALLLARFRSSGS
jgi:prevent-host-death family protein